MKTDLQKIAEAICCLTKPADRHELHLVNALYDLAGAAGADSAPSIRHSLDGIAEAISDLAGAVRSVARNTTPPAAQ